MKYFRYIANGIFLTLSCFLICYFLAQLTNNPIIRAGIIVFAVGLDIYMQYVLALGRANFKMRRWQNKARAVILFLCYSVYVLVYAIPSAVGFFMVEIDTQEAAVLQNSTIYTANTQRLQQIDRTIEALNQQLATESATGYGGRSKEIIAKIEGLSAEQAQLRRALQSTSAKSKPTSRSTFSSLSKALGIKENFLKVLIFGVSVAMLYVGLILTSWNVKLGETVPESELEEENELIKYVNAMLEAGEKKLNGNATISRMTGIPVEQCAVYRSEISRLVINGVPAITTMQGASMANHPKEVILKHLKR